MEGTHTAVTGTVTCNRNLDSNWGHNTDCDSNRNQNCNRNYNLNLDQDLNHVCESLVGIRPWHGSSFEVERKGVWWGEEHDDCYATVQMCGLGMGWEQYI